MFVTFPKLDKRSEICYTVVMYAKKNCTESRKKFIVHKEHQIT